GRVRKGRCLMSSFGMIFGIIKASSVAIAMHRQFSHSLNDHADGSDGPARIHNNRVRDDNRPKTPVYPAVADSPPDYANPRNAVAALHGWQLPHFAGC